MNKEEIDIDLYGILFMCPQGPRKDSCPFKQVDDWPFALKMRWLEQIEHLSLLENHYRCSKINQSS